MRKRATKHKSVLFKATTCDPTRKRVILRKKGVIQCEDELLNAKMYYSQRKRGIQRKNVVSMTGKCTIRRKILISNAETC